MTSTSEAAKPSGSLLNLSKKKEKNMKKLIFTLLALVGTMSLNAQVVKLYKDNVLVATYKASEVNNVVFEEAPAAPATTGTEKRTGDIDVNWVQLWEDGPRFAEYNVGAKNNKAEDNGGYYCWGKTTNKDEDNKFKDGESVLTGTDDTATNLWGSKWRMPTEAELEALLNNQNCTCTWTTQNGVIGLLCKGKENTDYSSNSVFLPAAGYCYYGSVYDQGSIGRYWSSTPNGNEKACNLYFFSGYQYVDYDYRNYGYSVRAVLKETPATTGVAKATIGGVETDVNWVQLWEGGPKFAEYNVGASSAADLGITMTFTEATSAEYLWGANWCTPNRDRMETCLQ